jgi:hypothetical protein
MLPQVLSSGSLVQSPASGGNRASWPASGGVQQHPTQVPCPLLLGLCDQTCRSSRHWRVQHLEEDLTDVFSYYNKRVEIHDSARKHGVADPDILHALDHALAIEDAGEDPDRWLLIGPDPAGNLLEVVVLIAAEGTQIVIHAMPMRDKYARLLDS